MDRLWKTIWKKVALVSDQDAQWGAAAQTDTFLPKKVLENIKLSTDVFPNYSRNSLR